MEQCLSNLPVATRLMRIFLYSRLLLLSFRKIDYYLLAFVLYSRRVNFKLSRFRHCEGVLRKSNSKQMTLMAPVIARHEAIQSLNQRVTDLRHW